MGGIVNEQGEDTRQAGGESVHVELDRLLRGDAAARASAAEAIAVGLTEASEAERPSLDTQLPARGSQRPVTS